MSSIDQKLDFIIAEISSLKEKTEAISSLVLKVGILEDKLAKCESTIITLSTEVKHLKDSVNSSDQEKRLNSLRIFNVPGSNSETGLTAKVYEEVLKPILAAAKAQGEIPTLPQVGNTVTEVFRAGKFSPGSNKPPPPIIVKFVNPVLRMAILKCKRSHTPAPPAGSKRIVIVEDLTHHTHRKFKELLADDRVQKVWTRSGVIWLVAKEGNQVKMVKSVYDSNDKILG